LDIQSLGVNQEKGEEAKLIKPRRRWVVVFLGIRQPDNIFIKNGQTLQEQSSVVSEVSLHYLSVRF